MIVTETDSRMNASRCEILMSDTAMMAGSQAAHDVEDRPDDVVARRREAEPGQEVVAVDLEADHAGDPGEQVAEDQAPARGAARAGTERPGHPDVERACRVDPGGELRRAVRDHQQHDHADAERQPGAVARGEEDEKREQRHCRARGHVGHRLGEHLRGGEDSLLKRDAGING